MYKICDVHDLFYNFWFTIFLQETTMTLPLMETRKASQGFRNEDFNIDQAL